MQSIEERVKEAIEYLQCLKKLDNVDINIVIDELLSILDFCNLTK